MPLTITLSRVWAAIVAGAFLALLVGLGIQTTRIEGFKIWPLSIKGMKAELSDCRDDRKADRKSYEDAQKQAADKNKAEVARIEAEQQKVTNEIQSDLNARLERLRRELRQGTAPDQRSPGSPKAGPDGKAPGGTADASGLCLTPDQLLRGAENEERHEQLIRWVEGQLKIAR